MDRSTDSDWHYLRRLLMTAAVLALGYLLWSISGLFLLAFASVLLAVLLTGIIELIERHTGLPRSWSYLTAFIGVALLLSSVALTFGVQVSGQIGEVVQRLPGALNAAGEQFGISNATAEVESALSAGPGGRILSQAAQVGYTALGAVADFVLVIVAALYLAADPQTYKRAICVLFPPAQQDRVVDAMNVTASALRLWSMGQLVSMVLVGALSGTAFWLLGLPSPIALGIIAGATNVVPLLGPILGALPAVLFAFTLDMATVLWTIGAVVAIQQVEGNLITPLVQERAAGLPPALVLLSIVAAGILFGWVGIFFAVPLAVAGMVLVKKLWIRETLGQRTDVPGEDS